MIEKSQGIRHRIIQILIHGDKHLTFKKLF